MDGFPDGWSGAPDRWLTPRSGRIVLGVSTSPAGLQALRYGVTESRRRGAPLYAVRAFAFEPPWHGPEVARFRDQFAADALRYVREAFDTAMAGVPCDIDVRIETPNARTEHALIAAANNIADVLVLGGHLWRRRPGRLIRYCLRHAGCPVVIVPPPDFARIGGRTAARGLLGEIGRLLGPPTAGG
jgi:nucleotide-binding universal stress UspA family protein